jgi:hypothetical protein
MISNTRRTAYDNKGVARLSRLKENNMGLSNVSGLHNVGVRTMIVTTMDVDDDAISLGSDFAFRRC